MAAATAAQAAQTGPGVAGVWEVAVGLALVLVVIFAVAWAMRRMVPGASGAGGALRVLSALPVGPRERILLVDAGGHQLLLGVTAQQINTLHSFEQPLVLPQSAPGTDFAARLREVLAPGTRR